MEKSRFIVYNDLEWYAAECGIQDAMRGASPAPELWYYPADGDAGWEQFKTTYHKLYEETRSSYEQIQILD